MEFNHHKSIPDTNDSTAYTSFTPSETAVSDCFDEDYLNPEATKISSSVPWPESTFILRSASTGDVLTLLNGQVVLDRPGGRGSIHWHCVETKGWLGLQNPVSGKFLGHDKQGRLSCFAAKHQLWEWFCVRAAPEGGYVLLLTHYERLWYVGSLEESGVNKLRKAERRENAIVWEFVKL